MYLMRQHTLTLSAIFRRSAMHPESSVRRRLSIHSGIDQQHIYNTPTLLHKTTARQQPALGTALKALLKAPLPTHHLESGALLKMSLSLITPPANEHHVSGPLSNLIYTVSSLLGMLWIYLLSRCRVN